MNIDPLAEKYISWSPYNYVMNDPTIFTDPDGKRVEWGDNLSSEEKQLLGSLIKRLRKESKAFDKLFKKLHNSKNVYKIAGDGASTDSASAEFEPNHGWENEVEDDDGFLIGMEFEETNDKGGKISVASKFVLNELSDNEDTRSLLTEQLTEEFVHAFQWESMDPYSKPISGDKENSFFKAFRMRNNLDYEFEAKAVSGIILNESNSSYDQNDYNAVAYKYGIGYSKKNFNLQNYYRDMRTWKNFKGTPKPYKKRSIGNIPPSVLLKLLR